MATETSYVTLYLSYDHDRNGLSFDLNRSTIYFQLYIGEYFLQVELYFISNML